MELQHASAADDRSSRTPGDDTVRRLDISEVPAAEVDEYVADGFAPNAADVFVERRGGSTYLVATR
jgi:hypothetical protein